MAVIGVPAWKRRNYGVLQRPCIAAATEQPFATVVKPRNLAGSTQWTNRIALVPYAILVALLVARVARCDQ